MVRCPNAPRPARIVPPTWPTSVRRPRSWWTWSGISQSAADERVGVHLTDAHRRSMSANSERIRQNLQVSSSGHAHSSEVCIHQVHATTTNQAKSAATNASGSNGRRSPTCSPTPTNRTGTPSAVLDGEDDAALGGRVELGQDDPGQADRLVERPAWARPFWPVVASSTNRVSGVGPGQALVDDAADLRQLVHEVRLGVQAPGGVGDDEVRATRDGRVDGVVDDGPGIGAGRMGHDRDARRGPPRSASCSMAAARNVSAAARMTDVPSAEYRLASLPMVVVLPVPLTPTMRTTAGPPSTDGSGAQARSRGTRRAASSARTAARRPGRVAAGDGPARRRPSASAAPTSPAMSVSSTSSQAGSSSPPPMTPRRRAMNPPRVRSRPASSDPSWIGATAGAAAGSITTDGDPARPRGRRSTRSARVPAIRRARSHRRSLRRSVSQPGSTPSGPCTVSGAASGTASGAASDSAGASRRRRQNAISRPSPARRGVAPRAPGPRRAAG